MDVLGEDREVRQVAVAHVDEEMESLVRDLEARYPTDEADPQSPVGRALREAHPVILRAGVDLPAIARDEAHLEGLRRLGLVSAMIVPLVARGQALGAITFLSTSSERVYDDSDLALAEQLAARAAIAVDNARLFREAEGRAQSARALATVGDGVVLLDARDIVRLWNPAAERITGLKADDVVGRPAEEAIPGWTVVRRVVPVAEAAAPAPRARTVPLEGVRGELWLSFSGVGFGEGTVYTFRDLTEERRLDELKADFVATASHELRTPVAAVYGAAMTLLRRDLRLDEDRRAQLLAVVAGESERLTRIVDDILWASRVDSGAMGIEIAPFDARDSARRVFEAAQAHLPPGIDLAFVCPPELPSVAADEGKLSQVISNLVENAVKYSPDGGRVELRLEPLDRSLVVSVEDEGLGIPASEQARVFEKFYRLDPNLTRGVGGTGLGLYICRELVQRMHGRIWVESREGVGSIFSVELPLAERTSAAADVPG